MYNYHNKTFRSLSNTVNGDINEETVFKYIQTGNIVTAIYSGGNIINGNIIALVEADGKLNIRYQHINLQFKLMTGICISTPQLLSNGKIRLLEKWQWTSGDLSTGESVIEEI